jgi:hypothetical protein
MGSLFTLFVFKMTVDLVYDVLSKLRLLARADIICNDYGDYVSGSINPDIEAIREQISCIHDRLHDGLKLSKNEKTTVHEAVSLIKRYHQTILRLERELRLG